MSNHTDIADDFTRTVVSDDATVPTLQIIIVIIGVGVTLPIFYLGAELTKQVGFQTAVTGFLVGCGLLSILGAVTGYIGAKTRMSSYILIQFCFGSLGAKFVNLLLGVALMGYYGATAGIFGEALSNAALSVAGIQIPNQILTIAGSAIMTLTAIYGFNAIDKLSLWSVPLMVLILILAVVLALNIPGADLLAHEGRDFKNAGFAISAVFGSCIQMSILMPDITRFARTARRGAYSILGLGIGYPLIFMTAAICYQITGKSDILLIMITLGIGIPAMVVLVFATWTTNTVNIYSTLLTFAVVFPKQRPLSIILCASALGTGFALVGIMDYFLPFITLLGIATPPLGGIYIVDFFFFNRGRYVLEDLHCKGRRPIGWAAMSSWCAAFLVGLAASMERVSITGLSGLDSLLVGAVLYGAIGTLLPKMLTAQSLIQKEVCA